MVWPGCGLLISAAGGEKTLGADSPNAPDPEWAETVRLALAASGGRHVAVKLFERRAYMQAKEVKCLHSEILLAQSLSHPNIVTTLGTLVLPGPQPALVMELLPANLSQILHERPVGTPPLSSALKQRLILEVARGVEYLHSEGVMHRDIKTANVLLTHELHAQVASRHEHMSTCC